HVHPKEATASASVERPHVARKHVLAVPRQRNPRERRRKTVRPHHLAFFADDVGDVGPTTYDEPRCGRDRAWAILGGYARQNTSNGPASDVLRVRTHTSVLACPYDHPVVHLGV